MTACILFLRRPSRILCLVCVVNVVACVFILSIPSKIVHENASKREIINSKLYSSWDFNYAWK